MSDAVPKFIRDHAAKLAAERPETVQAYLDADRSGELDAYDAIVIGLAGMSLRKLTFGEQAEILRRMLAKNGWRVVRTEQMVDIDNGYRITEEWTP